jgi:capsular polysaccharide biosynthesis protein
MNTNPHAFPPYGAPGGMPGGMPGMPPAGGPPVNEPTTRERINRAKTIARRAAQHWVVSIIILIVGCVVAIVLAMNTKSVYRSEVVIAFRAGFKVGKQDEGPAERAARLKPKLEEQVKSRARLEKMIKEFNLYESTVKSQGIITAIDEMRDKYVGFRGKDSERFVVSFEANDPELARKVTQRLAESIVEEFGKEALTQIKQQVEFLTDQETKLLTELDTANRELTTFLAAHPEFAAEMKKTGGMAPGPGVGFGTPTAPGGAAGGSPIVLSADPALNALLRQRQRIESQLKAIQGGGAAPATVPPELEARRARASGERDTAQNMVNEANAELGRLRASGISDEHPDMRAAKAKVTAAKNQLGAAEAKIRDIDQEIKLAQQSSTVAPTAENIDKLKKELAAVDAQIAAARGVKHTGDAGGKIEEPTGIVGLETSFQKLLRRSQEARTQLNELKEQVNKARLELASEQAKSSDSLDIAEAAFLPTKPSKGGKSKTAMTGGGVALVLAVLYALGRVAFSDRIIDAGDIEAMQIIPVLGVLPKIPGAGVATPAAAAGQPPGGPGNRPSAPGGPQGPAAGQGGVAGGPGAGMPPPIVPGQPRAQGGRPT